MTAMIRKCKSCGYCPAPEEAECPVDFSPFEFLCNLCKSWSRADKCDGCHQRVEFESRLADARRRNDLAGSLAAAQRLVDKYPGKSEYRHAYVCLQSASKAVEACRGIPALPLETCRGVKQAQDLLSQARSTLKNAGLSEALIDALGYVELVEKSAEELEGLERLKQQMVVAVPTALAAAVVFGVVWLMAHIVGAWSNHDPGGYLWLRNSLVAIMATLWLAYVARESWGIPGWLIAVMAVAPLFGLLFVTSIVYAYWPGLWLWLVTIAIATWLVESGQGKSADNNPLRKYVSNIARQCFSAAGPKTWAAVIIGAVVLFLAAPTFKQPQPPAPAAAWPAPADRPDTKTDATRPVEHLTAVVEEAPPPTVIVVKTVEPSPPTLSVDAVTPSHPVAGKKLTLTLAAEASVEGEMHFEYRRPGNEWTATPAHYVDDNPPEGKYRIEFRCADQDGQYSNELAHELTVVAAPQIVSVSADSDDLVEPATLKVNVQGNRPPGQLKFDCRRSPESRWYELDGDALTVFNLPAGPVEIEFRARDQYGNVSLAKTGKWNIAPLSTIPLEVILVEVEPSVPKIGSDVRVQLDCPRPSAGLVYKFREGGAAAWTDNPTGSHMINAAPAGELRLEYGVVDTSVGDHSQMYAKSWEVDEPRYEVTNVRTMGSRLVAEISDHDTGSEHVVGYNDALGRFTVRQISLTLYQVKASADNGTSLVLEIPREPVQRLREKARTEARGQTPSHYSQ